MGASHFSLIRLKYATANVAHRFLSSASKRLLSNLGEASDESNGESEVYKRALKLQRPTTVLYQENLRNSVSLIGEIELPLETCNSDNFGVYTVLKVKAIDNRRDFRVMLKFWHEVAETSFQHLKPNDLVYVSGRLRSYMKVGDDGKPVRKYEVNVRELNFVSQHSSNPGSHNHVKSEQEVQDIKQKRRDRLHLWQIFFASPNEWWDNRNSKSNPRAPDFRHKDTGEVLWISKSDPPWINQQLLLLDSRLSEQRSGRRRNALSNLSPLVFDEQT